MNNMKYRKYVLAGALASIRLCQCQIAVHSNTRKLVKHPAGDVIYQYFRVRGDPQHGVAMGTAHRHAMKRCANRRIADADLVQRAMGDRLFTFRTVTVT